jgi:hypothetical protein
MIQIVQEIGNKNTVTKRKDAIQKELYNTLRENVKLSRLVHYKNPVYIYMYLKVQIHIQWYC